MSKHSLYAYFLVVSLWGWIGCRPEKNIDQAFYHWKSKVDINEEASAYLKSIGVNKLYIRMFDITWNEQNQKVKPEAWVQFNKPLPAFIRIIPVVYIANDVFKKEKDPKKLAANTHQLLQSLFTQYHIKTDEIQIDCDWSLQTREAYFDFLKRLRARFPSVKWSATIRLHQIKYPEKTGIPPVDKGMLMFYNMGKVDSLEGPNSIFDEQIAALYTHKLPTYSLPLDVALPAFSWSVLFRNGKIIALLNDISEADLIQNTAFQQKSEMHWKADSSFFYKGRYFLKNDVIKVEKTTPQITLHSARILAPLLPTHSFTVSLFAFNNSLLSTYDKKHFDALRSIFN